MPYRIIKKVKKAVDPELISGEYSKNFGIELDEAKTWQHYPLFRPKPRIRGVISQVLDKEGNKLYDINEEFEFEIHCSQRYRADGGINEKRFLYLPADFVRGYGIDEDVFVDLVLQEVIVEIYGEINRTLLYPKILFKGTMDIQPKKNEEKDTNTSADTPKPKKRDTLDFKG